jgi:hypothetical protein
MKIKFVFILVFYFCLKVGAQSVCDYYCGREIWSTEDNLRGEIDIQVELKKKNDNTIVLRFKKTMKPFSQMLLVETEAYFYNDKYIFNFIDGWGNKGYGYFILKDKKMNLFLLIVTNFLMKVRLLDVYMFNTSFR